MDNRLDRLGLEFEAFRHDTKITLDMISELMVPGQADTRRLAGARRRPKVP